MAVKNNNLMGRKNPIFQCPACGNDLNRTDLPTIICSWCKTKIVPAGRTIIREADIAKRRSHEKNRKG